MLRLREEAVIISANEHADRCVARLATGGAVAIHCDSDDEGGKVALTLEQAHRRGQGTLVEHLGLVFEHVEPGHAAAHLDICSHHLAPNGYLHAATVVTLADTCCGYGAFASLPTGAENFTTIELKSNFISTARSGRIYCDARMIHGGHNTQVWDAEVKEDGSGKTIALFRCTQIMLYPRRAQAAAGS